MRQSIFALGLGVGLLGGALTNAAQAQAAAPAPSAAPLITIQEIGPGVYAALDGKDHKAGSNAGFVVGDTGVLVVDSFFNPEATKVLVAEIHKLTPKPIRYVVNTHYHMDHVAGDQVLRDAGATIIAQRNVRAWIHDDNLHLLGDRITPALRTQIAALAEPDITVDRSLTVWLGARRVDVRFYAGHTGGDLVVQIPDAKVIFCGDLLWRHVSPNVIDGTISKWIATESAFEALPGASAMTFVPGHGELARIEDVAAFQAYLADLTAFTSTARAAGLEGKALADQVLPQMKARYGDWGSFDYFAPKEIGFIEAELAGTKRIPTPPAE
jgi:glyoxylase-like metal-dependent hydrolase (beta-lactamase superfamily II)